MEIAQSLNTQLYQSVLTQEHNFVYGVGESHLYTCYRRLYQLTRLL